MYSIVFIYDNENAKEEVINVEADSLDKAIGMVTNNTWFVHHEDGQAKCINMDKVRTVSITEGDGSFQMHNISF